jgi:hypothetical protein
MAPSKGRRAAAGGRVRSVPISEDELHRSVAEFLDWVLLPPAVWTTFPAGWGKLTKATAGRLKASGLKDGMPDILIFPGQGRVLGIELKAGKNNTTINQDGMHKKLAEAGVVVEICWCLSDVVMALDTNQVLTRSHNLGDTSAKTCRPPQPDARAPQTA